MDEFPTVLAKTIESSFDGHQSKLADAKPKFDRGLLNKILSGERFPTAEAVGKLAAKLPKQEADSLIAAYLQDVARQVRASMKTAR